MQWNECEKQSLTQTQLNLCKYGSTLGFSFFLIKGGGVSEDFLERSPELLPSGSKHSILSGVGRRIQTKAEVAKEGDGKFQVNKD